MTRYVIDAATGIELATIPRDVHPDHELLAPTLWRSEVLSLLHERVAGGELDAATAVEVRDRAWKLKIRLLGDAVLRRVAWELADELGWSATYRAEYVALTKLQGDALITADPGLIEALDGRIATAGLEAVFRAQPFSGS